MGRATRSRTDIGGAELACNGSRDRPLAAEGKTWFYTRGVGRSAGHRGPGISWLTRSTEAIAAVAVLFGVLMTAGTAHAQTAIACEPSVPPALKLSQPPSALSWNSPFKPSWVDDYDAPNLTLGEVLVTWTAADPTKPISEPLTYSGTNPPRRSVYFKEGDGPAVLTYQWEETPAPYEDDTPRCSRTVSQVVRPIAGTPPTAAVRKTRSGVVMKVGQLCRDYYTATAGRVSISVSSRGRRTAITRNDQCSKRWSNKTDLPRGGDWSLRRFADRVLFLPDFQKSGKSRLEFSIRARDEILVEGRFVIETSITPSRRIYEGTDAFVNYCINESVRIWSHNGRLYCQTPKQARYRLTSFKRQK